MKKPSLPLRSLSLACALLGMVVGCGSGPVDPVLAYQQADYPAALAGFEARAEQGDPEAKNFLGVMYQLGLAVKADPERAAALFREAALAGSSDAQNNLGVLYLRGHGVVHDPMLAYGWFDLASRSGHVAGKAHAEEVGAQLSANMAKLGREQVDRLFRGDGDHTASAPAEHGTHGH